MAWYFSDRFSFACHIQREWQRANPRNRDSVDTSITATTGVLAKREIHAKPAKDGGYTLEYSDESGALYIFPDDNNAAVEVGVVTNDGVKLAKDAEGTRFGSTFKSGMQWGSSRPT